MSRIQGRRCTLVTLALLTGLFIQLRADVYLKQRERSDAFEMMGQKQPEKDVITEVWIAQDRMRSDNEEQSFIIRADKGVSYMIDHKEKTYVEMSADMIPEGVDQEDAAEFQKMMQGMMKMEISITPTAESKTIGRWKCKKYKQTIKTFMGPMESEIWASDDIKLDYTLYAKYASAMFSRMPGMQSLVESMMKEYEKIKGVPVLTTTTNTVMGKSVKSVTELIEAREGKAPPDFFELPKGYRKKKM